MTQKAVSTLPPLTRLSGPSFLPECEAVYGRALDALHAAGVPYLVGGALAFNAYTGIWRDTKDLDLFCRPEDWKRVLDALAAGGFQTEVVYDSWLAKGWVDGVFVDVIWRNANGLFPVTDEWLAHAPARELLGREVRVLPAEELILSKMMVGGRYRFDGADILHVLYATGHGLDWDRLAKGAGEHIGLLLAYLHMYRWGYPEWADRVPSHVLEEYAKLAQVQRSTFGPMRALLLDIQSFQVDVQDLGMPDPHRKVLEEIYAEEEGASG